MKNRALAALPPILAMVVTMSTGLPVRAAPTSGPGSTPATSSASTSSSGPGSSAAGGAPTAGNTQTLLNPGITPNLHGAIDPQKGIQTFGDLSSITPSVSTDAPKQFFRTILLWIGSNPLFHPSEEVDREIGDPWLLNPSTADKLDMLPARVRLQLYSALATHPSTIRGSAWQPPASGDPSSTGVIMMSPGEAGKFTNEMLSRLGNYFTPGELLDLSVFGLSKLPFFPKTRHEWDSLKNEIVANSAPLVMGAILVGLATGNINISLSDSFYRLPGDKFKVGWYASIRDMGFTLRPSLRGGVAASTPWLEGSIGVAEFINALPGAQRTAIELFLKEHMLAPLLQGTGWSASLWNSTRLIADSGNPAEIGQIYSDFSYIVSRDAFVKNAELAFMINGTFSTNYRGGMGARLAAGIEDVNRGAALGLNVSTIYDPKNPSGNGYQFGVFLGGNFESSAMMAESEMKNSRGRVDRRLDAVEKAKAARSLILEKLRPFGTGVINPLRENELISQLRASEERLYQARLALAAETKHYLDARAEYFLASSHRRRGELTEFDGPLPAETFEKVIAELGAPPKYLAHEHENKADTGTFQKTRNP